MFFGVFHQLILPLAALALQRPWQPAQQRNGTKFMYRKSRLTQLLKFSKAKLVDM
jgi:N-acetyl-beta-hexosaminidase